MNFSKHNRCVDDLVQRLLKKKGKIIYKEMPIYDSRGRLTYQADVAVFEYRGYKKFMTIYEVKTGQDFHRAYEQAAHAFDALRNKPNLHVDFVAVNPRLGVKRIRDYRFTEQPQGL
jgi:hypothetical protein